MISRPTPGAAVRRAPHPVRQPAEATPLPASPGPGLCPGLGAAHSAAVKTSIRAALAAAVLAACGASVGPSAAPNPASTHPSPIPPPAVPPLDRATTAFVGVQVVAMTGAAAVPDATVVVSDGRIAVVGARSTVPVPPAAAVVDGAGLWLMPGLVDAHVHVNTADLPEYVAHGVTSVRNMWGYDTLPAIARRVAAGEVLGPAIYSGSPGIDGTPPQWPQTQILEDPAGADALVQQQVRAGWLFVKVYQRLQPAVYDAVLAAARRHQIRAVGHVATGTTVEHALESGQACIEHLSGYDRSLSGSTGLDTRVWLRADPARMAELARRTRDAGTWNCPTHVIVRELARRGGTPDETRVIVENRHRMTRALREAGARVMAGSDAGIDVVPPGASLHDELQLLVDSGATPFQALQAATTDPADFLGLGSEIGTVSPGLRADLLLLRADPLRDVSATRDIAGVMLRGRWLPSRGGPVAAQPRPH
jgi:imidazolonepropionase-like amidohydrolase